MFSLKKKGVGFIFSKPFYKCLFGPKSISKLNFVNYSDTRKKYLITFRLAELFTSFSFFV